MSAGGRKHGISQSLQKGLGVGVGACGGLAAVDADLFFEEEAGGIMGLFREELAAIHHGLEELAGGAGRDGMFGEGEKDHVEDLLALLVAS